MFFKDRLISIAEIIDAKFKGYANIADNAPSDKGKLCELFIKQVLIDALGDSFKIFRGGRIVNCFGVESKQIDILLTGKLNIKLFEDKGIYPTETVYGCISVTATLSKNKLIDCFNEFKSIPKKGYSFLSHGYLPESYVKQSVNVWKTLLPYKCVFAYKGDIAEEWINDLKELSRSCEIPMNVIPDLIIVNKIGFIEKIPTKEMIPNFSFIKFSDVYKNYGLPFGKLLYHLNNFSREEYLLQPELKEYFNKDM
jgi:hypothetical protein